MLMMWYHYPQGLAACFRAFHSWIVPTAATVNCSLSWAIQTWTHIQKNPMAYHSSINHWLNKITPFSESHSNKRWRLSPLSFLSVIDFSPPPPYSWLMNWAPLVDSLPAPMGIITSTADGQRDPLLWQATARPSLANQCQLTSWLQEDPLVHQLQHRGE